MRAFGVICKDMNTREVNAKRQIIDIDQEKAYWPKDTEFEEKFLMGYILDQMLLR